MSFGVISSEFFCKGIERERTQLGCQRAATLVGHSMAHLIFNANFKGAFHGFRVFWPLTDL